MINSSGTCNVDRETVAGIQGRMMGIRWGVLVPLGQCVREEKQLNGPSAFLVEVKAKPGKNARVFLPITASCSDFTLGKTTGRLSSFFLFLTLCGMWRNKANQITSFPPLFK